jgi:hypothetical protein
MSMSTIITVPRKLAIRWSTHHARRSHAAAGMGNTEAQHRHRRLAHLITDAYLGKHDEHVDVVVPDDLLHAARWYGPVVPYLDGRK